jgi:hypothetical protein
MAEHFGLIMTLWAALTIVFGSGVSWATVKITLRGVQKDIAERDRRSEKRDILLDNLQQRITADEQAYVKVPDCKENQVKCGRDRDFHEDVIIQRLDDLKEGIASVILEQKAVREELYGRLDKINDELRLRDKRVIE